MERKASIFVFPCKSNSEYLETVGYAGINIGCYYRIFSNFNKMNDIICVINDGYY